MISTPIPGTFLCTPMFPPEGKCGVIGKGFTVRYNGEAKWSATWPALSLPATTRWRWTCKPGKGANRFC